MHRIVIGALAASALALGCQRYEHPHMGSPGISTDQAAHRNLDVHGDDQPGTGISGAAANASGHATESRDTHNNISPHVSSIAGMVKDSGDDSITITTADHGDLKLQLGSEAELLGIDRRPIVAGDIKPGQQVDASYVTDGQKNFAERIQIKSQR